VDVDDKKRVSWFLGLTCDFWAEMAKEKLRHQQRQWIQLFWVEPLVEKRISPLRCSQET
jgi:hypothetical protein